MSRKQLFLAGLPLLVGFLAGLLVNFTNLPNSLIFIRMDLAGWLSLAGLLGSGLVLIIQLYRNKLTEVQQKAKTQAGEDRRRFLRRLDHELKNPLTAVLAGLANIPYLDGAEAQQQVLESIQDQVNRIRSLSADLRKLAELEERPLEKDDVNLSDLIEEVYQSLLPEADERDIEIDLSLPRAPWPLPLIPGDRDLLVLAVFNLLINAIKFTPSGERIEIRAFEDSSHVLVEFADTGMGIAEKDQGQIWDELFRGENTAGIPGSGLGLALVRTIVHKHQGDIDFRSRSGAGTVFTLRLPV